MADKTVSLVIRAKDAASGTIKGVGTIASKVADKIRASWKMAGASVTAINQGLEIGKKVLAALGAAYDATAGKALALRAANDPARKAIEGLGKATDALGVALGDALVPALATVARQIEPVIRYAIDYLNTNRKLIASSLIPWLLEVGKTFTTVVAGGILGASKALSGWSQIYNAAADVAHQANAAIARDAAERIKSELLNSQGLSEQQSQFLLKRLADAERLAAAEDKAANKSADAVGQAIADQAELEGKINLVSAAIRRAFEPGVAQLDAFDKKVIATAGHVVEFHAKLKDLRWQRLAADTDAYLQKLDDVAASQLEVATAKGTLDISKTINANIAALERQNANIKLADDVIGATAEKIGGVTQSVIGGLVDMVRQGIDGTMKAGEVILGFFGGIGEAILSSIVNTVASMVTTWVAGQIAMAFATEESAAAQVAANTAVAQSAAIAGNAGIPFVGIGIGIAAALALAGIIAGFASAGGLAEGGLITSGTGVHDDVPARLMRGEYVIPADQVRENVRSGRAPDDSGASGGGAGSGGGGLHAHVHTHSLLQPSRAEVRALVLSEVAPAIEHLHRTGRLKLRGTRS